MHFFPRTPQISPEERSFFLKNSLGISLRISLHIFFHISLHIFLHISLHISLSSILSPRKERSLFFSVQKRKHFFPRSFSISLSLFIDIFFQFSPHIFLSEGAKHYTPSKKQSSAPCLSPNISPHISLHTSLSLLRLPQKRKRRVERNMWRDIRREILGKRY